MKRTIIIFALIAALAVSFCACGGSKLDTGADTAETAAADTTAAEETAAEETASEETAAPAEDAAADTAAEEAAEEEAQPLSELCFASGNVTIYMMDKIDDVKAALGEPTGDFESASCAYQGSDYFYYYTGFTVQGNTVDDTDTQYVTGITVDDDRVATPEGIKIGMDIEEAAALLPEGYTVSGTVYTVESGNTTLTIQEKDGSVAKIQYLAAQE